MIRTHRVGAILRAGGSEIQEECLRRAPIRTEEADIPWTSVRGG